MAMNAQLAWLGGSTNGSKASAVRTFTKAMKPSVMRRSPEVFTSAFQTACSTAARMGSSRIHAVMRLLARWRTYARLLPFDQASRRRTLGYRIARGEGLGEH